MTRDIETDVLVVGAGPAGGGAGLFLSQNGVRNLVISKYSHTPTTPRAHITNQRTMEALRDVGLEQLCAAQSSPSEYMAHTLWLSSMVGDELARIYSWGNDPARKGDYELASPCRMCDLPQSYLEPILLNGAAQRGSVVRFDTELLTFKQDADGVTAEVRDGLTGPYTVRAKYLLGADGGRSRVVEQLGLPLRGKHGLGNAFNVFCDVDLSAYVSTRPGVLYYVLQPEAPPWSQIGNFRMVRPWNQWLVTLFVNDAVGEPEPSPDEVVERVRGLIGDDSIPVNIRSTFRWAINNVIAERYSDGRVFCLGDAVHRHPPANGLGSNTSIQDAFNLAWKLALVLRGRADPSLLDSFSDERQPVGAQVVERANKSIRHNDPIWEAVGLGVFSQRPVEERIALQDARMAPTIEGAALRADFQRHIDACVHEFHAHGVELNQRYRSAAIVADGTPEPAFERDPELYYQPSTRPGAPLPHVWLGAGGPRPRFSTLDLAGKGRFALFTGTCGEPWREAAREASAKLGVEIKANVIGPDREVRDLYGDWARISEVEESGCVLVRPDLYVAWRCPALPSDPAAELVRAMRRLLGFARAGASAQVSPALVENQRS